MSNLILIDDQQIRKRAFSALEKLLKKLQRMETNVESFHGRDERLFHEWFELTFREDNQKVANLRGQYRELADFHNQMHAFSQMEDVALPEAAYLLREEARLYESGTPAQKALIEEARRMREEFVRSQTSRNERRQKRDAEPEKEDRYAPPDEEDLEEVELIGELDDEELEEWCASSQTAFLLLGKTLRVASFTKDFDLFFRLWDATHPKIQRDFAKEFERAHGYSLLEAIEQMRTETRSRRDVDIEDEQAESGGGSDANRASTPEGERLEALKLVYRQLVRKLHPDMNDDDTAAEKIWRKQMWARVQEAYQREDLKGLNKLFHLVLLRTRDLDQLRLSELHLSHRWVSDEIERMNEMVKRLRRKPAWNFSKRKDFEPIKRKIERDLRKVRRELEDQVIELRTHHSYLERIGRESIQHRRSRRSRF